MAFILSLTALFAATLAALGWVLVLVKGWAALSAVRRLPHEIPDDDAPRPRVSVVLAARNEEQLIERCVRSLLQQEGVALQVVAVDDASEDRTLELLRGMAQSDDRLLVLSQKKLPSGWVAKNYALELGQGRADGEHILFTDADVIFGRRAILSAVQVMKRERLDHLAIHPRLEASTLFESIVLPIFALLSEFRFLDPRAVDATSGVGAGIGAFNMVRAEAYRLRGTHARIRGAVLDDRALGRMMRDDGGRGTVMRAVTQVRMRPYRTVGALYAGIRKGMLSACGNSAALCLLGGLGLAFGALGPPLLLMAGGPLAYAGEVPWGSLVALTSLAVPIIGLLRVRAMVRFEPAAALLYPIGALVIAVATLHAAVVYGAKGTVEWRGRQYNRRDLRDAG